MGKRAKADMFSIGEIDREVHRTLRALVYLLIEIQTDGGFKPAGQSYRDAQDEPQS